MFGWIYNRFKGIAQRFGWGRAIALTVLFGFVMLRAWDPVPLELLRLKSFDLYQLLKPRTVTQRPVVIVDIDEPSLEALGQWPWPRTLMAKLVDEVMAKGAVALAFDIVFAEPDRTSPHLIAEALPELSEAARNEMRKAPSHDTILAEALKRSRVVLGQSAYNPRGLKLRKDPVPRAGYATVGGKGGQRRPQKLGVWRIPIFILCLIPLVCAIVLPALALLTTSFMKNLGGGLVWSNFTLWNYHFILTNDAVRVSIYNTILLAIMAATGATIVAAISAFIAQRKLIRGHQYMGFMATAPIGIPGIVLAVGLFAAYTKQPFVLYGTLWIMFLAYLTKYLPLAYQTSNAGLSSIHPELEESCRIMGANRLQVFKDVTVPLFKTAVIASWILVFMPSLRELSASVLLWTTNTKVISVVIVDFYEETLLGPISALGVLLLLITLVAIAVGFRLVGRDFMRSAG